MPSTDPAKKERSKARIVERREGPRDVPEPATYQSSSFLGYKRDIVKCLPSREIPGAKYKVRVITLGKMF